MSVATALLLSKDADLVATVNRAADSIPDFRLTVVECAIDLFETASLEDATLLIVHLTAQSDESELISLLHKSAQSPNPLVTLVISDKYDPRQELTVLQAGASGYSARPIDPKKLATLVDVLTVRDRFLANISVSDPDNARSSDTGAEEDCMPLHDSFLYSSPLMTRMMSQIVKVAASDTGILLTGETGTGKTHLARWIHGMSPRRQRPFLTVNCASLSTSLIESELFGHVKGAFTGAHQQRAGKLAEAQDGTLLLDEIDALPYESQAKLLQAVDEKIFVEVGSNRLQHIQARLIAATNRSLNEEVAAGRFRADLHFRLNVIEFKLPPLRERRSEIRGFARQFVKQCAHRLDREVPHIDLKALKLLELYPWPGNIRELRNAVERGVTLCTNNSITIDDLPENILEHSATENDVSDFQAHHGTDVSRRANFPKMPNNAFRSSEIQPVSNKFYSQSMLPEGISKLASVRQRAEVEFILEVLERQNNNRQQTARELGISRVALYKKLHKYGLIKTR